MTANEDIRDALIKRQIQLVKDSGAAARDIKDELEGAFKELKERIDARLRKIIEAGADTGPTQTKRLLALEEEIRGVLKKPHRTISKRVQDLLDTTAVRDPRAVREIFKDKLPVVVSFGLPSVKQLREIVRDYPVDGTPIGPLLEKFATDNVDRIMAEIHNRMPVILCEDGHEKWLDLDTDPGELLKPCPDEWLEAYPVGKRVGNVRNNDADLLTPC